MRISKISGEFWKKEDSDRTGNCWENGDSRVKSTEIFVFLAQNCRIFWISNCTFSIKNGKNRWKSLAKRLQVCYNKGSTVQKWTIFSAVGDGKFLSKTMPFSFAMQAIGTERNPEARQAVSDNGRFCRTMHPVATNPGKSASTFFPASNNCIADRPDGVFRLPYKRCSHRLLYTHLKWINKRSIRYVQKTFSSRLFLYHGSSAAVISDWRCSTYCGSNPWRDDIYCNLLYHVPWRFLWLSQPQRLRCRQHRKAAMARWSGTGLTPEHLL